MFETSINQGLRILKYHALGNSYLIVDPRYLTGHNELLKNLSDGTHLPTEWLVKLLCSASHGIGSNGLLFGPVIQPDESGTCKSGKQLFELRIFNSDATMAGLSGNGVRIFAKYLVDAGYVVNRLGEVIRIEVVEHIPLKTQPQRNAVNVSIIDTTGPQLEVAIETPPRFGPEAVGANMNLIQYQQPWYRVQGISNLAKRIVPTADVWNKSAFVDIGNPHCVTFVDRIEHLPMISALAGIRHELQSIAYRTTNNIGNNTFIHGCNLQWAFIENRSQIRMTIFERGEGPTEASGSSASAVAAVAFKYGLVDSDINIVMPGGTLKIFLHGTPDNVHNLSLVGSATRVLDGYVDLEPLLKNTRSITPPTELLNQ